jgi:hypothetical protein
VTRFDGAKWPILGGPINPAMSGGLNPSSGASVMVGIDGMGRFIVDLVGGSLLNLYVVAVNH